MGEILPIGGHSKERTPSHMEVVPLRRPVVVTAVEFLMGAVKPSVESSADPVQFTEQHAAAPNMSLAKRIGEAPVADQQAADQSGLNLVESEDFMPESVSAESADLKLVSGPHRNLEGTEVFPSGPRADGMAYEAEDGTDVMNVIDPGSFEQPPQIQIEDAA